MVLREEDQGIAASLHWSPSTKGLHLTELEVWTAEEGAKKFPSFSLVYFWSWIEKMSDLVAQCWRVQDMLPHEGGRHWKTTEVLVSNLLEKTCYAFQKNRSILSPFCWQSILGYRLSFPSEAEEQEHISQTTVLSPGLLSAQVFCIAIINKGMTGLIFPFDKRGKDMRIEAGFLFSC